MRFQIIVNHSSSNNIGKVESETDFMEQALSLFRNNKYLGMVQLWDRKKLIKEKHNSLQK